MLQKTKEGFRTEAKNEAKLTRKLLEKKEILDSKANFSATYRYSSDYERAPPAVLRKIGFELA